MAQNKLNQIKQQWQQAKKLARRVSRSAGQDRLFKNLYWAGSNPLVHESMHICEARGWDSKHLEVKHMAWEQWCALSDTKRVLEDVFAALKQAAAQNKNMRMSRPRTFFEAASSSALTPSGQSKCVAGAACVDTDPAINMSLGRDDWQKPLVTPLERMGEGMYTTPNHHKPEGLDLHVIRKGVARAAVPWKPAGPAAMQRMAAASCYLTQEAWRDWAGADSAWDGILLSTFGIFKDLQDDSFFISLGFNSWIALVLPLEHLEIDGTNHFFIQKGVRVKAVSNHDVSLASPFQGIPVEELAPRDCPGELAHVGVAWYQIHPPMDLVRYAVLCRCCLDVRALRCICKAFEVAVQRLPHRKTVTREAYASALVRHFFGEEPWETQAELAYGVINGDAGLLAVGIGSWD